MSNTQVAMDAVKQLFKADEEIALLKEQRDELLAALILAKDMMIANDLSLPYTFEVIDDAIAKAKGE